MDPCPSRQPPESAATSNLGDTIPVTTGARTSTTATITSTYVTCSTVGGSAYVQDGRMPPSVGLASMRPVRQVFVSQPLQLVEPPGVFPRARDSLGTLRPEMGTGGLDWGERVARSDVPPEVNGVPVVNGLGDRAVYPVPPGERYQSRGPEGNPVAVERAVTFAPDSRDEGMVITVQYRLMVPAAAEAGGVPRPGAHRPSSVPVKIGLEPPGRLRQTAEGGFEAPCSLRQACPPSAVHAYPPQTGQRACGKCFGTANCCTGRSSSRAVGSSPD